MLAVTIFILLPCACTLAQLDIHEKKDGYTVVQSDPNAGDNELYTSTYQLVKFFETEKSKNILMAHEVCILIQSTMHAWKYFSLITNPINCVLEQVTMRILSE